MPYLDHNSTKDSNMNSTKPQATDAKLQKPIKITKTYCVSVINYPSMPLKAVPIKIQSSSSFDKLCFYIENVFSETECENLIAMTEKKGYEVALVNVGGGEQVEILDYRKSARCIVDDVKLAQVIFDRIKFAVPQEFKGKQVVGLNERLRFLRYDPGDFFKPHFDGAYTRPDGSQRTLITIQLYLNEGFKGGETTFLSPDDPSYRMPYVPKTGSVLVFEHRILHEGSLLEEGRKYTVRSDILYTNGW
jgi:predicted 2-oxoglutarate/Fe(II)-dependent dioxygenase YbiX